MADKRTTGKQGSGMSFANLLRIIRAELGDNFVVKDSKTDKAKKKTTKREKLFSRNWYA